MIRDIILQDTTIDEWNVIKDKIKNKIFLTFGKKPEQTNYYNFEILSESFLEEKKLVEFRFNFLTNYQCYGSILYPNEKLLKEKNPGALCIHGSDGGKFGHKSLLGLEKFPNRQYAKELAEIGFITVSVDQYGFGAWNQKAPTPQLIDDFYADFPEWSLDGIRLEIQKQALEILINTEKVDSEKISVIGNSIGGRISLFLSAFDERVKVSVPSAGVSPNITNIYRNVTGNQKRRNSPILNEENVKNGKPIYEFSEVLSLAAPRGLILLEPFNDPYNPYIETVFRCFDKAKFVYQLYGKPQNIFLLSHGYGHDTPKDIRKYSYSFMETFLNP